MRCNKISYPSKDIAARMSALLRIHFAPSKKQIPYPCPECPYWHLKTRKNHRSSGQRAVKRGDKWMRI